MDRSRRWRPSPRRARRDQLLLAGAVPSLAALVVALVLLTLVVRNDLGAAAYDEGDHESARERFAANRWLRLVEPWVAPLNEGDAHHRLGEYADAVDDFTVALRDAPTAWVCPIRLNLALAWERLGDERAAADDADSGGAEEARGAAARDAEDAWRTGRTALADGRCTELVDDPTVDWRRADAQEADERLSDKVTASVEESAARLEEELSAEELARLRELERQQARAREREARIREEQPDDAPLDGPQDDEDPPTPGEPGGPGEGGSFEW
ncbi:hypothetical protein AB0N29_03610 [Nocardioides sp. NPDC092400]|uniref:hypothetical protein n=1 Tax=Nocardioides sp. NPDC092400 TaxID=3155196 RepID=UPI00342FB0F4